MSELQSLLDREARRVSAVPGALDGVLRRVDRRRRNRKVGTAIFALILAAAAISTLVRAFERSELRPARPPRITDQNVADLRMAWTATPGGCCPMPQVVGDTVYVGWNDGVSAYPLYCKTGGATCKPIWVGSVRGVGHHPTTSIDEYGANRLQTPVVADGMVFASDYKRLYAFPVDCATGGAICEPSWFAHPALLPIAANALTPPAVGSGVVVVGVGGTLYAYPTHCGTGATVCKPAWAAQGDGAPSVSDGIVYGSDAHDLYAYPADCGTGGATCEPLWVGAVNGTPACCWDPPTVVDDLVYVGTTAGSLYAFPTSCGTGGATCEPVWIGATGERGGGVVSWTVDDGMAFAGTTRAGTSYAQAGHVYAFSTTCGTVVCKPLWTVTVDADPWLAARNGLLFVATHGGFIAAYEERCHSSGGRCEPLWTAATFDGGLPFAPPPITDRALYSGGDSGRVYAYTVPSKEAFSGPS